MKKLLTLLAIFAFLISCSTDDGPKEPTFDIQQLMGTWAYDQILADDMWLQYPHAEGCIKDHFTFQNTDAQPNFFEEAIFNADGCSGTYTHLRWVATGDHVKLYFGEIYIGRITVIELTDTTLDFYIEADINGDGTTDVQEFKAVRYDPFAPV